VLQREHREQQQIDHHGTQVSREWNRSATAAAAANRSYKRREKIA
jgi:hypothetical protein